ncbi:type II secretion system protein [Planctomycetota bacterium]|nr:type II secretion system protein [Planctomycetota bacterium]
MKSAEKYGFTLIELLVVISIIGLLIGILLPALSVARSRAISVKCKSNLRQVGLAMQSYLQDFDEYLPSAKFMPSPIASGDPRQGLPKVMSSYLPLDNENKNPIYHCDGDDVLYDTCGSSYVYEIMFRGKKVVQLSQLMKLWGEDISESEVWLMYDYEPSRVELQNGTHLDITEFHREYNIVFADGHVDGLTADDFEED